MMLTISGDSLLVILSVLLLLAGGLIGYAIGESRYNYYDSDTDDNSDSWHEGYGEGWDDAAAATRLQQTTMNYQCCNPPETETPVSSETPDAATPQTETSILDADAATSADH